MFQRITTAARAAAAREQARRDQVRVARALPRDPDERVDEWQTSRDPRDAITLVLPFPMRRRTARRYIAAMTALGVLVVLTTFPILGLWALTAAGGVVLGTQWTLRTAAEIRDSRAAKSLRTGRG